MKKEQYETLLAALADKLKEKEDEIALQATHISILKMQLKEAESVKNSGKSKPANLEIR